jgi:hypothetical protein
MADIEAAQRRLTDRVIDLDGVSGTAIGLDGNSPCLKVMVSTDEAATQIPRTVDGFKVVVETTGSFKRW